MSENKNTLHSREWRKKNPEAQKVIARRQRERRKANPQKYEEWKAYQREYMRRKRVENRDEMLQKERAWRSKNRRRILDRQRHTRHQRQYGITLAEKHALLTSQGNKCAICGSKKPSGRHGWVTDHCHTHGHVRGVLCNRCNLLLGQAKDSIATLAAAIGYLYKWQTLNLQPRRPAQRSCARKPSEE